MRKFDSNDRPTLWAFVYRAGVPHIRFNARRSMFGGITLND